MMLDPVFDIIIFFVIISTNMRKLLI